MKELTKTDLLLFAFFIGAVSVLLAWLTPQENKQVEEIWIQAQCTLKDLSGDVYEQTFLVPADTRTLEIDPANGAWYLTAVGEGKRIRLKPAIIAIEKFTIHREDDAD
jgi:hypothetical protein